MPKIEKNKNAISESVSIGKCRTAAVIKALNELSEAKHNNIVKFEFAAGDPKEGQINSKDNTEMNRLHGGRVGIAVRCTYGKLEAYMHVRAVLNVDDLSDATLTTESKKVRKGKYGLLEGSYIMAVILNAEEKPIKYAVFEFNDLVKWGCVEYRADRDTFVRAHLNKVSERLTPFAGRTRSIGLVYEDDDLDAVEKIVSLMRDKQSYEGI